MRTIGLTLCGRSPEEDACSPEEQIGLLAVAYSRGRSTAEGTNGEAARRADLMQKGADIHIPACTLSVFCMQCADRLITECMYEITVFVYIMRQNALSLDAMRPCIALPLVSN